MRYTIETARNLFSDNGCELLEETYRNSSTPMLYRCKCGATSAIALADFKRGRRCRKCGNIKAGNTRQDLAVDPENMQSFFEKAGCKLLSKYSGYTQPLDYVCECGRLGRTTWWSFQLGRRCGCCADKRSKKYTIEEVRQIFSKNGCKLLDDTYADSATPVKYQCSCGSVSMIALNNFNHGSRCKKCGFKKTIGSNNHRWIADRAKKKQNDIFKGRCGQMVRRCFVHMGKKKNDHTVKLLGYTAADLIKRITEHKNWDKVKDGKWHIDHIFPIHAFLEHNITDLKVINRLDNLQPLSGSDNVKKSFKYEKKKFRDWLDSKGIQWK